MAKKSTNSRKRRRGAKSSTSVPAKETNGWDALIRFIDALYDLAQTGNILGLFSFGFLAWVFSVTYKLPADMVGGFIGSLGLFFASEKYYLFPLSFTLIVSLITNSVQARVYRRHIKDLTDHRKVLVHGLESGELKTLDIHESSEFDIENEHGNWGDR